MSIAARLGLVVVLLTAATYGLLLFAIGVGWVMDQLGFLAADNPDYSDRHASPRDGAERWLNGGWTPDTKDPK